MKTIPNVIFKIKESDAKDAKNSTAAFLLKMCLAQPPPVGFDFSTMRARNRIADALDKSKPGGEIKLEDADFAAAVECVKSMKWGANHPDLLKFGELFGL